MFCVLSVHHLDTNKLRNVAKFFAHLLFTDAITWEVLQHIRLTEEDTTSSSRIFIKILFQVILNCQIVILCIQFVCFFRSWQSIWDYQNCINDFVTQPCQFALKEFFHEIILRTLDFPSTFLLQLVWEV